MPLSALEFIPLTEDLELLPFKCKDDDLNDFFTRKDERADTRLMYFDLKPFKEAQEKEKIINKQT